MKPFLTLCLCSCLVLFTGCNRVSSKVRDAYMDAYFEGDFDKAEKILNDSSSKTDAPFRNYPNAIWFRMERGTLRFINNQAPGAVSDYAHAIDATDYYLQESLNEEIGTLLISDESRAFVGEDYEQSLLRLYFAFALFQKGEHSNGLALLRQIQSFEELRQENYRSGIFTENYIVPKNPIGLYLLGLFHEKEGDYSNAKILFKKAKENMPTLDIGSEKILFPEKIKRKRGTLLVICHNGNAPYRISVSHTPTEATILYTELLLTMAGHPTALGSFASLPKISIPALKNWPDSFPTPTSVTVGEEVRPCIPLYNVYKAAESALEQSLPLTVSRAVARFLIRKITADAARNSKGMAGDLFDLGTFIANQLTQADTRAWNTLPYTIDIARFDLPPGEYPLSVRRFQEQEKPLAKIEIKKGQIRMIHLFNIHPYTFRYLIPEDIIIKGDPS